MSISAFLTTLIAKGIEVWAEGDRLRVRGPQQTLTPAFMDELRTRKSDLLAYLVAHPHAIPGLALSNAQQSIWNAYRAAPDSPAYNVNGVLALRDDYDHDALERALLGVANRHLSLRCRFRIGEDGAPAQFADPKPVIALARRQIDGDSGDFDAAIDAEIDHRFDLESDLPLRCSVFRRNDTEAAYFVFVIHHIAVDFWAAGIFIEELMQAYAAQKQGLPDSLKPPAMDLRDFVAQERERLSAPDIETDFAYFEALLDDDEAGIQLPIDRTRPRARSYSGRSFELPLSDELAKRLRALAKQEQVTPYVTLLAVYAVLLSRIGRKKVLRFGLPTSGRYLAGTEDLVANMVNLLPYVADVDGAATFVELLADSRIRLSGLMSRQHVPYADLVRRFARRRDGSHSPFFDVLFNWNKVAAPQLAGDAVFTNYVRGSSTGRSGATHDLALSIVESGDRLSCLWTYDHSVFDEGTVRGYASAFNCLAAQLLDSPGRKLWTAALLDPAVEALAAAAVTRGAAVPVDFQPFHRLIERQALLAPEAIALIDDQQRITYGELNARANRLARALRKRGAGPEQCIAVWLERGCEFVVACLAIAKSGSAFVPLALSLPRERVELICGDSKVVMLLADSAPSGAKDLLAESGIALAFIDRMAEESESPENIDIDVAPISLAYVIYTSGSTGSPKGVMIEHAGLTDHLAWHCEHYSFDANSVVPQIGSIAFDASIMEIWPALISGGRVTFVPRDVTAIPSRLPAYFDEQGVTWAFLIAPLFDAVAPDAWLEVPSLRALSVGGDRVRTRLPSATVQLDNVYGPTESTVLTVFGLIEPGESAELPYLGRPISNSEVLVIDGDAELTPSGTQGELAIASPGLARGYLRDPRRTAELFRPHPYALTPGERLYYTGDLGRYRADGRLEFLGRIDRQLKLRGYRIEPGEIEQTLLRQANVSAAKLLCIGNGRNARLVAFCAGTAESETLRTALRACLPGFMVPASIEVLECLPLNSSGKIDESALIRLASQESSRALLAPATRTEHALMPIWREVLGRDDIGVDDDFFESGGHSLTAAQVVERIRRDLGRDLPIASLLANPNVQALAAWMDADPTQDSAAPLASTGAIAIHIDRDARHLPFPLTDVQHAYWAGRAAGFELGNTATHIYTEQGLAEFDGAQVNRVWNRLIRRHEMLRAVVSVDGLQRVLPEVPDYCIEIDDLCGLDEVSREAHLLATRERMSHQVFDPQHWPMFEIRVSRIEASLYRMHTSVDALIADARSFGLLESEYDVIAAGQEPSLPQLELSFRDYVLAERLAREGNPRESAKAYWQSRLDNFPGAPALPLAVDPADIEKPVFKRRAAKLDAALWQQLKLRAKRLRATPSALLLAAYAEVLGQWSAEPRFALNLTLFNRQPLHPHVNYLVGDFTSLTLLEVVTGDACEFATRVQRCQNQLWTDLEHRAFTGVEVLRELGRRNGSRPAGMPVVFTSILPLDSEEADSNSAAPDYAITQTSQVWIDHVAEERSGALVYHWDSVEALFPPGLLDDMFAAYEELLVRLAREDSIWQRSAPIELPRRQQQARAAYNDTVTAVPAGLIYQGFLDRAALAPTALALVADGISLSYGELRALSTALALRLRERGVRPNQLVAIEMRKGWEQVVAALAVTMAGAAYMPVDANLPVSRRVQLFEQGGVTLALVQPHAQRSVVDGVECIEVYRDMAHPAPPFESHPDLSDCDLAYVIFTSGSTGVPKGVMIDHRGAVNTIFDINARFDIGAEDRVLALSSLSFDLSVYDIFGLLTAGGAIVLPNEEAVRNPQHWSTYLHRHGVTVFNAVPSFMQMLVDYLDTDPAQDIGSLRLAMMSGDWIPVTLPARIRAIAPNCRMVSLGGATEASVWSIWHDIDRVDPAWRSIPYGRPMGNQSIHVLRTDLSPAPDWVAGALFIGGIGLAQGYWGDQAKTDASFITHPYTGERLYRTGDMGRLVPQGWVEFLGRADTQVKVQGHRIELAEVETHLAQHAAVREVAVAVRGEGPGRGLYAYIVPAQARLKEQAAQASRSAVDFASDQGDALDPEVAVIDDPIDRLLFKFARHGLRRFAEDAERIVLPEQTTLQLDLREDVAARGMQTLGQLSVLLSALRAVPQAGAPLPKFHYPSAGSLYPVQAHVLIGRGLPQTGAYYYDPDAHALVRIGDCRLPTPQFQIVLVGDLGAITPLYGSLGLGFCNLEAGYVEALLVAAASAHDVALSSRNVDSIGAPLADELRLGPAQRVLALLNEDEQAALPLQCPDARVVWTELPSVAGLGRFTLQALARQSYRQYLASPLPLASLARILNVARSSDVQVWLYAKAERIAGLDGGLYRVSPDGKSVLQVASAADAAIAECFVADNMALFEQSAFVVVVTGAVRSNALLRESGQIGGRLGLAAAEGLIGLCGIGYLREGALVAALPALHGMTVLHSLVGGAIEAEQKSRWQAVAKPNAEQALSRQMDTHIRERLPEYMAPRGYIVLDALPLNSNGKVDRKALPVPGVEAQQARSYVAPQGSLEQLIADVWKELLGVERVSRDESFFALGGNSVLIVQMFGRLSAQIAVTFSVADLFAHVTIADLAVHLSSSDAQAQASSSDVDDRAAKRRSARSRPRQPAPLTEGS